MEEEIIREICEKCNRRENFIRLLVQICQDMNVKNVKECISQFLV